jgi:hypothetical protein
VKTVRHPISIGVLIGGFDRLGVHLHGDNGCTPNGSHNAVHSAARAHVEHAISWPDIVRDYLRQPQRIRRIDPWRYHESGSEDVNRNRVVPPPAFQGRLVPLA